MKADRVLVAILPLLAAPTLVRADSHPVFSLIDNRPLAHLQRRGGFYVEAGTSGMARYVHFSRPLPTWKLRASHEGRRVALASAQATLEVPLTAAQARTNTMWIGMHAPARSTVKVSGHNQTTAPIPLQPGWQVVKAALPEGLLVTGENTIHLGFAQLGNYGGERKAAAVEFVQIGGTPPDRADAPSAGDTLKLPAGGGLAWFVRVPEGGTLAATGDGGGCQVMAAVNGEADRELRLDGTPLDLSAHAKKYARLDVKATGSCGAATLKTAALFTGTPAPQRAAKNPPKHVIVWLSDSTRADKWKIYNPKTRVETPFMSELAKRATVFRSAYTQGNESRVSHASLFTSMYPSVHNMISDKAKLNPDFTILPEAVHQGRYTAGVMGNGYIDKFWGFGDGWDFLVNHIHSGGGLSADDLLKVALGIINKLTAKPLFLYLGTIDAHVSWRAHEPWISRYDPPGYSGPFVKACLDPQLDKMVAGKMKITDRDRVRVQSLYDSDISYTDSVLRKLFDNMAAHGHDGDTMVIFTGDHGEEMWDHGKVGHGQSLHEELVHVPLVIYYPPLFPAGKVVEEGVDVMDILPTVTDVLGLPTPDAVQGESLAPLAQGFGAGYPRPSIASQYELAHTMRLGGFKLWVGGSGDAHLYDVVADAHEDKDLWASRPFERRALTDALGLWMANRNQWKKRKWGVASNLSPGFAADMKE